MNAKTKGWILILFAALFFILFWTFFIILTPDWSGSIPGLLYHFLIIPFAGGAIFSVLTFYGNAALEESEKGKDIKKAKFSLIWLVVCGILFSILPFINALFE